MDTFLPTEQRQQYERGIKAATRAVELEPESPEGHFWMAADMGAMAESFGMRAGIRYRGPIKTELETVLRLDPSFQQGSADRALGRWYFRRSPPVRRQQGQGDRTPEALPRVRTRTAPRPTYFLAETYLDMDRPDEARRELQLVLDAPLHPEWTPEDREFKQKAKELLARSPVG